MKLLGFAALLVVVAVASALGGYLFGRHMRVSSEDRQTAIADAQDAVAAYNAYYSHWSGHIAAAPIRVAPHIYQFVIKENGKRSFGCFQINTRQFWAGNNNGDRIDLHGVGVWGGKCKRR